MHDAIFAASIRPPTPEILGLRMLPYTIGHEILLHTEVRSLIVLDPADFAELPLNQRVAALYRAVLICSTDYHSYINAAPRIVVRSFLGIKRNWRVKMHHWVNVWTREMAALAQKEGETFWINVEKQLRDHLLASRQTVPALSAAVPEDKEAYEIANEGKILGENGRSLGGPLLASLLLFVEKHEKLVSAFRFPLSAFPFDVPYALALNLFLVDLENEGSLPIENALEAKARREMAEHRADLRAEKAKQAEKQTELTKSTELGGQPDAAPKNSDHSVNSV